MSGKGPGLDLSKYMKGHWMHAFIPFLRCYHLGFTEFDFGIHPSWYRPYLHKSWCCVMAMELHWAHSNAKGWIPFNIALLLAWKITFCTTFLPLISKHGCWIFLSFRKDNNQTDFATHVCGTPCRIFSTQGRQVAPEWNTQQSIRMLPWDLNPGGLFVFQGR